MFEDYIRQGLIYPTALTTFVARGWWWWLVDETHSLTWAQNHGVRLVTLTFTNFQQFTFVQHKKREKYGQFLTQDLW